MHRTVSQCLHRQWIDKRCLDSGIFLQPDMYKLMCMAYCWFCRHSLFGDMMTYCNGKQSAPEDSLVLSSWAQAEHYPVGLFFSQIHWWPTIDSVLPPTLSSTHKPRFIFCCKVSDVWGKIFISLAHLTEHSIPDLVPFRSCQLHCCVYYAYGRLSCFRSVITELSFF